MSSVPSRHAVFGHPVAHSLSPEIHSAFARQTGIALDYVAVDTGVDGFAAALDAFAAGGGRGANVTLPLKEAARMLCRSVSDRAQRGNAVNTLTLGDDGWHGDNTDGTGLLRDLRNRQALDLRERRTLLIGAGGAAHGIAPSLLDAGVSQLFIVNRDTARADALVDALGLPGRVHARYYADLADLGEYDLIINATSAGRNGRLPKLPMSLVGSRTACVDLSYGEAAIDFLAWARAARAHDVIDGLGMLVEQAADSFALWHGTRPETDEVLALLRGRSAVLVTAD